MFSQRIPLLLVIIAVAVVVGIDPSLCPVAAQGNSNMTRLSAAAGAAGEEKFHVVCATPDGTRVIYGTFASPARLVAYRVSDNSRIEGVTLAAGSNLATGCVVSSDGATLIASTSTSPAKSIKHSVVGLAQAASPLTLNSGEDRAASAARDLSSIFCFFALKTTPAKCAKIQWSDNTRVAVIDMSTTDKAGTGIAFDVATTDLVICTNTQPAYVVKIATIPTFARTSSLQLHSGENSGAYVTIVDGFSFIPCYARPGIVVKVKNLDMTRVGAVTLTLDNPRGSVADWKFLYVVTGTDPASVVQMRLSDLSVVSSMALQEGQGIMGALPGGSRSAGVAFFSMNKNGQLGLSVKVQLDASGAVEPPATMKRVSAASAAAGEVKFHAVCATSDRVIFGTFTKPARLVAYHVSNNSRIEGVKLAEGFYFAQECIISSDNATLIASMQTDPAKFVKHKVDGIAEAATPLTLNSGENQGRYGARDSIFCFFALGMTPAKCAKLRWSDNTRVAVVTMSAGEKLGNGLDIDTATSDLIMSTSTLPAAVIKISTTPTFARVSSLQLNSGEDKGWYVTIVDAFSFISCQVSPGIVVKVKNSDMTRVRAVTLSVDLANGGVADFTYLYIVTNTDPANIVRVRLSDLTEVSVLRLQEGNGMTGALPGGNRSAGVAFFSMWKTGQLGMSVKVQLDESGAVVPNMLRVSVGNGSAGEEKFHAVCASPDGMRVVYGTFASPARLVAYHVNNNSRIGGVTLAVRVNLAASCVISADGASLIASMHTSPAKCVKHNVVGLAQAASPLTLNTGEDSATGAARDSASTFCFVALRTTPAKCAKIQWSDNSRVGVIGMSSGEDNSNDIAFDTATTDLLMCSHTKPAFAIKISTTPTFAHTSSLRLNTGEDEGWYVTIADSYSFISCYVSPGIVVKVKNADMTRVGAVTLSVNSSRGSVADWKSLYVVSFTDPASVVQVRLSDLSVVSSMALQEGQGIMGALPGGNRGAGVAFFSMNKNGQLGLSVKVQLDAGGAVAPSMLRVSAATAAAGEEQFFAVCASPDGMRVVYGTYTSPARLVAYHVSSNSRIEGVTLATNYNEALGCLISADGATLIASMHTSPAKFVTHSVVGLAQAASPLTLNSGEDRATGAARDLASTFCFFSLKTMPAKCAKIQWSDNSRVGVIGMSSGENEGNDIAFDTTTTDLLMSTFTAPAFAIKISTSPTLARTASLQLNTGENNGMAVTIADSYSFISCYVSPGIVVKVKNADMTRVGAVTLSVKSPRGSVADWQFLYTVSFTNPASVVQVRLSDLTEVSVLQLQEGAGIAGALPGGNRGAGVAFFSMNKNGQLGLSVKVQLDASGAVAPSMLRLSVAVGGAGEEKFHAVCATSERAVFGTYSTPARLVAYHVSNNSRIEGIELVPGIDNAYDCIISHDGATLIASTFSGPAKFVKHKVVGLAQVASPLTLNSGESQGRFGCSDATSTFCFFGLKTMPAKCAKIQWSDNSRVAVIVMSSGENSGMGLDVDAVTSDLIMSASTFPAYVIKIATTPTFARTTSVRLNSGENNGNFVTIADGFSFVLCYVSPGIVVKVKNADMSRVGAVTLSVNLANGGVADFKYIYIVTNTDPANIVQVKMSDLAEVSVLQLQEGFGKLGALPGGNRGAGVAFLSMYDAAQLGLSVKVQLDASGAVVPNMLRLSAATAAAGEEKFHVVCATPTRAVFGTWTEPARLVAYHVSNNTRIDGVKLAAGINNPRYCIVSADGATLIASLDTNRAKFVQHNVVGLAEAASPLTLNTGEGRGTFGARDSTFCFFALKNTPAKCAKLRWSDNTRVTVIDMSSGENDGYSLDIDTATNDLIMSTYQSPAYAIKISTSPTFARMSSLQLNSGENDAACVTVADSFSFISCHVSPGIVVKVKNADMTRVGALTLSVNTPRSHVADWQFLYVLCDTDPSDIVQVRLSDLSEVSVLRLQEGEGTAAALPGGNRSAGVAFFSMFKSGQLGLSVKVQLDASGAVDPNPPPTMKRMSAAFADTGEKNFYAVCATPTRVVYGTYASPARLLAYHVSNNSRIEGVTLAAGINNAIDCVVSHDGATLLASLYTEPAKFVKHHVDGLGQAAAPLTLNRGEGKGFFGVRDATSTFAFFALEVTPAKCAKLRWSDNTRVAVIGVNSAEDLGRGLGIDAATSDLIMSTHTSPTHVVKIATTPMFARTSSLQLNGGEDFGGFVTIADGYSFISCVVSPGIVVKIKNSAMARVGAFTLSVDKPFGSVADWQYLYAVARTDPAAVVQVRLSDLSEISVLQLQEGGGVGAALPGGNRSAGVAFFSMYKVGQLGLSVKVQLDSRGAVAPSMQRLSAAVGAAGEEQFFAVCASGERVIFGTFTSPARLVAYHVSNNSRIEGVTLGSGINLAFDCVTSHDGATLIASMNTDPASFVKHNVADLSQAASPLTLNSGEDRSRFGYCDSTSSFAFFALFVSPAKCAKLRWSDNTRVAVIDMSAGEFSGVCLDLDTATNDLVMSARVAPTYVVKISTTPTFARMSSLQLNTGENHGFSLRISNGFSFISCQTSPGRIVKVKNSDMTRAGAVTLSVNSPYGSVADWKFLYIVSNSDPANVVQVRLSDLTEVSVLQLQEGEGRVGTLPGGNRSAGVAFFSMLKSGQLGLSVKVQLDASGAVCDSNCPATTTTATTTEPPSTTTTRISTTAAAATTTTSSTAAPDATTTSTANLDTSTTTTSAGGVTTTTAAAPSTTNTTTATATATATAAPNTTTAAATTNTTTTPPNATPNATANTTDAPPPPAQPAPIPGTLTTDEQIATDASQSVFAGIASVAGAPQAAMIASRAISIPQIAACTGRNADGKRWLSATVSFPKSYFPSPVGVGASSGFHARGAMLSMFIVVLAALVLATVAACFMFKSKFSLLAPMFITRIAAVAFGQVINPLGELAGMIMFAEDGGGGGADTALVAVPIIVVAFLALVVAVAIYRAAISTKTRTLFYAPSVVEDIPPADDDGDASGAAKPADGDDQQLLENRGSSSTVFAIVNGAFGRVCLTGTTAWYNPSNSAVFPLIRHMIGCDATVPDTKEKIEQKAKAKAADVKAASAKSRSKNTSKQAEHAAMHAVQAERSQAAGAMIRGTLAPFSIVIVALAALFAGFCTGIAKAAPDSHCKPMLAVIAVINVFIFLFDFAVRPQIVPMRGYIMLFCNGCAALMSVLVAALLGTEEAARKKRGLVAFINFGSTAVVIVAMFGLFFIVVLRPLLLRVLKMQIVPTAAAMAAMPERAKELAGAEAEKAKGGRRALDQTVSARKFRSAFEQELLTHSPRHGDDDDADDMLRRPSRGHRDRDRDREHRRHHSSRSHRSHRDDKHGDDDDDDDKKHRHHRHDHHSRSRDASNKPSAEAEGAEQEVDRDRHHRHHRHHHRRHHSSSRKDEKDREDDTETKKKEHHHRHESPRRHHHRHRHDEDTAMPAAAAAAAAAVSSSASPPRTSKRH